jgi:CBS domain-containing protein
MIAAEVMNRGCFYISPSDSIGAILREMAERGMGSAPVLDGVGRPLGVAIVSEIESADEVEELNERLTRPALCMDQGTPIDVVARALASSNTEVAVLVNAQGVAVGSLSSSEVLRCLLGNDVAPSTEEAYPRDERWEQAALLELGAAHQAPQAPGVILLSPGFGDGGRRLVWAGAAPNMRERLEEMLRHPDDDTGLEQLIQVYPRSLRFRCLTVHDACQREQLASALCNVGQGIAHPVPFEPQLATLGSPVTLQAEPARAR